MSVLDHFSLPYIGLKDGIHRVLFTADKQFFAEFEHSPIKDGYFEIVLDIDKRAGLSILQFHISGTASAICDRCLADIRLPVVSENILHVKVSDIESDDDEVIFLKTDQSQLNVAQIVYEFICLAMPIVTVYDCESENPRVCNMDVLNKISPYDENNSEGKTNGLWSSLENLHLDN